MYGRDILLGGHSPYHAYACGPTAVSEATDFFALPKPTTRQVSAEIWDGSHLGTALRKILGIIDWKAERITWPWEIQNALHRHGIHYIKITGSHQDLKKQLFEFERQKRPVLVMIHRRNVLDYHYIVSPPASKVATYYGDYTVICIIYQLFKDDGPIPQPTTYE
jgi:hypothetical protein